MNVPRSLHVLIPIVEKWGIGDDYEREHLISTASLEELKKLVECYNLIDENDLWSWLAGDESFGDKPTFEYLAFTNMTMAVESAKLKIYLQS